MTDEVKQEDELVIPVDLLDKDPLELAESEEDIQTIVTYLRATRENIRATEKAVQCRG